MKKIQKIILFNIFLISALLSQSNYALSFDGINDWAEAQTLNISNSPFTIETWAKISEVSFSRQVNLIDNYETGAGTDAQSWGIYIRGTNDSNTGKVYFSNGDIYSDNRIDDNLWHHIAIVRNSSGVLQMYIDGILNSTESLPLSNNLNPGHTIKIIGHLSRFMECSISELQVSLDATYDSNFSPSSSLTTSSSSILHFNFNEGTGSTLIDQSDTGNNGTINGASWQLLNQYPVASNVAGSTSEDVDYSSSLSGSDADGDAITYALASSPSNGSAILTSATQGTFTYSPTANYNGTDTFTYTVNDGSNTSSAGTVTMTITAVNDPPVASNLAATTAEDSDYSGSLSGTDIDGDGLTYAIASNPSNGTITLSNVSQGTFTYSPSANYNGSDTFTYTVSDGSELSNAAEVTLTISSVIDRFYVSEESGSDLNDGSLNNPYATIQAGINISGNSDSIIVSAGTYSENINFNGKTIYLKGASAPTTIIDGGQNGSAVQLIGGEASGTTIRYFTMKNGLATYGGGILVNNSSNVNLLDVIIKGNSGDYGAGVSVSDNSSVTIKNGLLYNNQSSIQGGALYVTESSQITAFSSTIAYNSVSGNSASASGNGVAIGTASSFTANSSIVWGNTGSFSQINIPSPQFGGSASVTYSNIGGGWFGTGNVNADPYFTDSDNGDFTLEDYSSLIGLGASSGLPTKDLAGNARPNPAGSTSDIGAYENENASSQRAMAVQNLDVGGQENLQHISDHTPLISFDYSDNASQTQTSYQVQVSTDSDFSDIDMWDTGQVASSETSTTYAGTELVDGATYHLRAKASASDFSSGWATISFRLNSTVAVGNLTFNPQYNESNVYTTVEFPTISSSPSADSESDALSVKYILSTNSSFTNKVDSSTVTVSSSTASWQPSIDPSDNQQYWIKASTYDGYEYGTETDASTFILNNENDAPDAFALSSPVGGAEVTSLKPVLDWPDVNDVDPLDVLNYTLYLDTPDPGITTIEVGTASTYEISTSLDDNTTYYWKVKATDAAGLSRENTGGYQSFRVNTENDLPAQFSLLAPENTSMVTDLTPTLLWNEPTDADDRSSRSIDSYSVYIGTDNAFTDVTPIVATSNNYTPSSNLTENILYYWKVVATDDDGGETTSATWSFWTNSENSAPVQFTLTSPEEGDETGLTPTFTWAKSSDADLNDELSYTLSLGSNQSILSDIEVSSNSSSDNYSLSFDGVDDWIEAPNIDLTNQPFTIQVWIKMPTVSFDYRTNIIDSYETSGALNRWGVYVEGALEAEPGVVSLSLFGAEATIYSDNRVDDNDWHHVAAVRDASGLLKLFIDGSLEASLASEISDNYTNSFITRIGSGHLGRYMECSIGGVQLAFEALFSDDFTSSYPLSSSPNSILDYPFNDGSGDVSTDQSGNGNNGTINGASWSTDVPSINSNSISYTSATNLTDNTEYHWQVTAEDQSGATYTTPLQSFVVNAENDLPSDFDLLSPGNTTMATDLTPALHWEEPTDPDLQGSIASYSVYVSTDNAFADATPQVVATNTYTVSTDLTEDALHYWKVVATDDDGGETSSPTWSFWTNSINSSPSEFTLISPEQDEETGLTPTFSWNESSDLDLYDELAYNLSFGTDPSDLTIITSSSEEFSGNNYSLSFDGTNDYVDGGISEDYNFSEFTAEVWIKVEGVSNYNQTIIAKSDNSNSEEFILEIWRDQNSRKVGFGINSRQNNQVFAATENIVEYGQWMHVAGTFDGDSLKIYIDGEKHIAELADVTFNNYNNNLFIGKANNNNNSKFGGGMDEIRLWNYARSPEQILSNMNYQLSGLEQGLVAHWNFNEGSGSSLSDQTENGNNGIINGATWSSDVPAGSSGEVLSGTSYTPSTDLTDDTEYHWQITAEDQSGATYTTPLQSFVVNAENDLPSSFALLSPGNTTMVTDLTPELHWEEPTDPDLQGSIASYSVYVSIDNSFADVTPEVVATNTHTVSTDLTEDVLYYWKVVATDDDEGETSSATWSFWTNNINSAPAEFTLVSPEQDEETGLTPTFSWNESSDADLYDEIAYTLSYGIDPSELTDVTSSSEDNYSLSFDGVNDYVAIENNGINELFSGANIISISLWVYGDGGGDDGVTRNIVSKGLSVTGNTNPKTYQLFKQNNGTISFILYSTNSNYIGAHIPQGNLNAEDWNNITITYDGGYDSNSITFVVNGNILSFQGENTGTYTGMNINSDPLFLGSRVSSENSEGFMAWNAKIDEVYLWSRILVYEEISQIYEGTNTPSINNGLVALWTFNEGSGNVFYDQSGNGNNGTINGAAWSSDAPNLGSSGEVLSGTSFSPSIDFNDDTEYHWQVTAEDQSGATYTTPLQSFVVNAENDLPSDFDLLSPGNTTMVTDLTPELHWEEPTDPDLQGSIASYSVYVSIDNLFEDVTPEVVATNTHTISTDLTEDALHYWKVVATDDDGGETSSGTWSFWTNNINSAPAEFTLVSPGQDEETGLTPTFNWNESSDADLYDQLTYSLHYGIDPSNLNLADNPENDAPNFSTSGGWINVSLDNYGIENSFSIETWIKHTNPNNSNQVIVDGMTSGNFLFFISNSKLGFSLDDLEVFGQSDLGDSEWHHVTAVYEAPNIYLYVDGVLDGAGEYEGDFEDISDLTFLYRQGFTGSNFSGFVDEIRLWDSAKNQEQVQSQMDIILSGEENNLIGYWNFDQEIPEELAFLTPEDYTPYDLSPFGNNGTPFMGNIQYEESPPLQLSGEELNFSSFTPVDNLNDNTEYHWQVTAEDLSGATYTTPLQSFIVNSENDLPSAFVLLSPESMAMVTDLTPTLHWQEPTDADVRNNRSIESYNVYLGTDDSFNNVSPVTVSSNYYEIEFELDENTSYFWKVVAIDDDGGETTSNTRTFWINNENSSPAEFSLLTPEEGEETILTPTFTWTESTDEDLYDVVGYTLKYGTDPTDLDLVEPFEAGTRINYSLSFDGEDDYILMENFQIPEPYLYDATIELWFKSNIDPQSFSEEGFEGAHLLKKSGLYEEMDLRLFEDSLGFEWESNIFGIQEGAHMLQGAYNDAGWHHYAVQISDSTTLSVFIDGVKAYEEIVSEEAPNFFDFSGPFTNLLIGTNSDQQSSFFKGLISEMKISSVAQYAENFNPDSLISDESTVSLWKFNANSGDVLYDLSGNENHGAIYGEPTWTTDVPALYGQAGLIVGTSYTTEFDLSDNTRYYWQVTATDLSGATYETEIQSFIVNLENDNPDMFSLLAPENTSMVIDLTPTFYWEVPIDQDDTRSRSIESYFIYYGTGIEDLTVEVVNSNSFTVMEPLIEDTTYFWKVVARDDDGGETQTETWSFWTNSVNSSPTSFTLLTPEENQDVNPRPTFSWTESNDDDLYDEIGYTIQIGTDPFNLEDVTPPAQIDEENFSVEFDGQDDFIEIEYFEGLDISEDYTWMFDVQFYDINSNAMLIENNSFYNTDGYYINYMDSRVWFSLCSDGICYQYSTTENNFLNDTWYNIQIVKLGGVMSIYVDGVNATDEVSYNITPEEDISQYYVSNTESLIIGLNTSGDPQPFSGKIDRLSLWEMALDEMQVEYYHATSPSGLEEGVIGYWNFNQGDGDIVSDLSGNENNGTLNGTVWVQEEESDNGQNDNITYYLPEVDLLDNTEYYWQVIASDPSGATSTTSLQSFFVNSDNDNPTGFTLQSPDSGSSIPNSSEILLFWDVTTDIDGDQVNYELYFGNDPEILELVDVVGVNYYEMQNLVEETYFWSVTAYDDLGGSISSAVWSFEVVSATNNAPLAFSIISPDNGGQSDSLEVELTWESTTDFDLGDTVSYQVELGENINSLNTIYNGPETEFTTEELLDNTTYYWRVLARDLNGAATENNGGIFTFTVNTENDLPSDFALLVPENGAVVTDLTPTFVWEEPTDEDDEVASIGTGLSSFNPNVFQVGSNRRSPSIQPGLQRLSFDSDRNSSNSRSIASYDIYIGTDTLFTDIIPVAVEVNNYTPTESLTEDTIYYWKVLATDNDGGQTESITQSFTTNSQNSAPSEFTLLTPFSGEEADTLPVLFSWTESYDLDTNLGDEVTYVLELGENIDDMETIYTGIDTVFITDQLIDNTNYYWRVLATDLNGAATENMEGIHSFMLNMENDLPGDFALFFPEDGSMVTDLTPTFMWEEPDDQDDAVASFGNQTFILNTNRHLQNNVKKSFPLQSHNAGRNSTNSRSIEGYDVFISSDILFTDIDPVRIDSSSYTIGTSLAENVEYFWKIVAIDDDGGQTESAVYSFWTNSQNSPPTEIDLLTPERDGVTGTRPLFSWTESSDDDINDNVSYTLVYGSDVTSLIYVEVDDELSHFTIDSLFDNTEYFWQVIATDGSGASFTTVLQSFFVNAENDNPEGFALLSPDSGTVVQAFEQYLIWLPSMDLDGDTVEYEVFFNNQSIGVTSHNYMEVRDLMDDSTYEWYVIASDGIGGITTSVTWFFTVNAENNAPSEFSLLSPLDEALFTSAGITFNWQSSFDVDIHDSVAYRLHIESEDTNMVIETGDTSLFIEDFMDNQIYHWSVIAYDINGGTTNNIDGLRMFVVNLSNDTPSIVGLMAPNEGSTQSDLTPNFAWSNSYDPDPLDMVSYNLSWWEPFSTDIQSVNVDSNGFTPNGYLMDNAVYQWRIKSEDLSGAASYSDTIYFYTDAYAEPPVNFSTIAPAPDASMSSTVVNFKWYSTIDPDPNEVIKYRIAYSTDWSDTSTYVYTAEIEDTSMSILLYNNLQYFWVAQAIDKDDFIVSSNYNTPNTFIIGTLSTEENLIPNEFALHQNFPNPFNPTTTIRYDLPNEEDVSITIFDVVGRNIRSLINQKQSAGYYRIQWDAKNDLGDPVSAGMYFYIIHAGEHRSVKKMVLLK